MTFREEGLGLRRGPIVGIWESRLEPRGSQFSGAHNGQLAACISSLTLTVEITEFAEVHMQIGDMSQNYPFISKNLKWRGKQQNLYINEIW